MKALEGISNLNHDHLVRWFAAFTKGSKRYLMFEWADGGSLRDFWKKTSPSEFNLDRTRILIRETLVQFQGLADGLCKLHMDKRFRHGDIKPENILRFKDGTLVGRLKIADFGLSRQHNKETVGRGPTITKFTTMEYESPEGFKAAAGNAALSRLSDIWSMGCVILEYIIWLLYGFEELERFHAEIQGISKNKRPLYENAPSGQARIRPRVVLWMQHMRPACVGTAIGDLLELVERNLLVIPTRPDWKAALDGNVAKARPPPGERASAPELLKEINSILSKVGKESGQAYLFKGESRDRLKAPPPRRATTILLQRPVDPNDLLRPDAALPPRALLTVEEDAVQAEPVEISIVS